MDAPSEADRFETVAAGSEAVEDAFGGARPEDAAAVLEDGPDLSVREPLARGVSRDALLAKPFEAAVGRPDPEAAFAIFEKREDAVGGEPLGLPEAHEPSVAETEEAPVGRDPDVAVAIASEGPDERVGESLRGAVEPGHAAFDAHEAACRAGPEARRIGVRQKRQHDARKPVPDRPELEAAARALEAGRAPWAPAQR